MAILEPSISAAWGARNPPFGTSSWEVGPRGEARVLLQGEIDVLAVPSFLRCLDELLAAGRRRLVLDMAEVDFIDSVGLSAIAQANKRMAARGGSLRLRRPSARVRRVLDMVGMTSFVPLDEH